MTLDIHPTWGFETTARWQVAVHQKGEQAKQKEVEPGFSGEKRRIVNNLSKIAAYLPGLHIIIGIARIIFSVWQDGEDKWLRMERVCRGIAEILVGGLLIIPDIWKTVQDNRVVEDYMKQHPEAKQIQSL